MNDLFHFAAARERAGSNAKVKLLVLPIGQKSNQACPLICRTHTALFSLLAIPHLKSEFNIQIMRGYDERLKTMSFYGNEDSAALQMEKLLSHCQTQVNYSLRIKDKKKYGSHRVDAISVYDSTCEIIELKLHLADKEAFIELMQNLYGVLVDMQYAKKNDHNVDSLSLEFPADLEISPPEVRYSGISKNKKRRDIISKLSNIDSLILRAIGTEQFAGTDFNFSTEFDLMTKQLIDNPVKPEDIVIIDN